MGTDQVAQLLEGLQPLVGLAGVAVFVALLWLIWPKRQDDGAATAPERLEALASERHPALVRLYKGEQQQDAVSRFEAEAATLARQGYYPTSQSWAAGQWGCGAFLVALLLAIVLIGILIFLYMLIVKPEGTLTVTYELRGAAPQAPPTAWPQASQLTARLADLDQARQAGLITEQEYLAKRKEILSGF